MFLSCCTIVYSMLGVFCMHCHELMTKTWLTLFLVTGDAAVAGVGEGVVVLVDHGQALAEVELLPREAVLGVIIVMNREKKIFSGELRDGLEISFNKACPVYPVCCLSYLSYLSCLSCLPSLGTSLRNLGISWSLSQRVPVHLQLHRYNSSFKLQLKLETCLQSCSENYAVIILRKYFHKTDCPNDTVYKFAWLSHSHYSDLFTFTWSGQPCDSVRRSLVIVTASIALLPLPDEK